MKYKDCPKCKESIANSRKRCPHCNHALYSFIALGYSPKRDLEIVELLKTGSCSLQQVGDMYGVSRERIRQVWKKETQTNYRLRILTKKDQRKQERKAYLKEIKYNCSACGVPVTRGDGMYKHKYCNDCSHIRMKTYRDPMTTLKCDSCSKAFHPLSNWNSPSIRKKVNKGKKFCSFDCYMQFVVNRKQGKEKNPS